jgi:hypothetical protein
MKWQPKGNIIKLFSNINRYIHHIKKAETRMSNNNNSCAILKANLAELNLEANSAALLHGLLGRTPELTK